MEGVARISSAVFVHANGLGSAFQVAIHSRTLFSSATTPFVDAAFERLIDLASRRVKLRGLHPQFRNQLLALFSVSCDISEFDIFVSAHDIR